MHGIPNCLEKSLGMDEKILAIGGIQVGRAEDGPGGTN